MVHMLKMAVVVMVHIMEHVAFAYRNQIEQQLGASLPSPEDNLKPEIENQLSRLVAQAAQQLLQKNSGEMAQQQAQQQAQDPLIQMQQQELQIKAQEAATKEKKVVGDLAAKADEIRLKEMELNAKHEADGLRIGVDKLPGIGSQTLAAMDGHYEGWT